MAQLNPLARDPSDTPAASTSIPGEVVAVEDGRVRVRLQSGVVGFVSAGSTSLYLGQRGTFRIEQPSDQGESLLSVVTIHEADAPHSFEDDVDRLQSAIHHRHAAAAARAEGPLPTMDEQRIQHWLDQVTRSLDRLRRNRAKRLDEEFYSKP